MFFSFHVLCSAVMPIRCPYFLDLQELTFHFPFSHGKVHFGCTGAHGFVLDFARKGI